MTAPRGTRSAFWRPGLRVLAGGAETCPPPAERWLSAVGPGRPAPFPEMNPAEQPVPSPGSTAIAEGILSAGYGPEKIADIVEGFREAPALEREIAAAMAGFTTSQLADLARVRGELAHPRGARSSCLRAVPDPEPEMEAEP